MILHCVLWNDQLIAVFSCVTDAHECAKGLLGSSVVQCHLNDYTEAGKQVVRNPA
jgi:hypothetical protein